MNEFAYFEHRNGCLIPSDDKAIQLVGKVAKRNKGVLVKMHTPRNPRHHRLFFALMNEVIEGGGWDGSTNTLLVWVKVATGHVETFISPTGKTVYTPKSISFGSMPQNEFAPFFDAAIREVCKRLLSGASEAALRQRIEQAVDYGYSGLKRGE